MDFSALGVLSVHISLSGKERAMDFSQCWLPLLPELVCNSQVRGKGKRFTEAGWRDIFFYLRIKIEVSELHHYHHLQHFTCIIRHSRLKIQDYLIALLEKINLWLNKLIAVDSIPHCILTSFKSEDNHCKHIF